MKTGGFYSRLAVAVKDKFTFVQLQAAHWPHSLSEIKNNYHSQNVLGYKLSTNLWNPIMSAIPASKQTPHLAMLKKGESATVVGLSSADDAEQLAIKVRLLELGFAVGEKIRVVAESFPRRDPMAVRVGNTTFALRRAEAAMIQIAPSGLSQA